MFDYRLCKNMSRMMEAKRFSDIVGLIYDCVPEPSGWQNVLRILTEEFRGIIATLAVLDINTRTSRFGAAHGDPRIVDPLVTTYAAHMPFYDLVARIDTDEPQTFAALCALHGPNGREVLHAFPRGSVSISSRPASASARWSSTSPRTARRSRRRSLRPLR